MLRALTRPFARASASMAPVRVAPISMSAEVKDALQAGRPVVALESTIISHGMPYPQNLETAEALEGIIRSNGATPATIAILKGTVTVGMDAQQLKGFASLAPKDVLKASRRDIGPAVANGLDAATTVAGTMCIARQAGISVFATGGLGGVHRGAELSFDVSADLTELGKTRVAVVSAGVKSILDIGKTLEVLETQGVPVLGFQCDKFPAFFSAKSPFNCPGRANTFAEVAKAFLAMEQLNIETGMVVAVPNPSPFDGEVIESAIFQALKEAKELGMIGKLETPFVLKRVNELTKGASLTANIALVKNNARVAAGIAVELAKLRGPRSQAPLGGPQGPFSQGSVRRMSTASTSGAGDVGAPAVAAAPAPKARKPRAKKAGAGGSKPVVVIGGAVVDMMCQPKVGTKLVLETSNPGTVRQQLGGVGRNVAECAARLGTKVLFMSVVGQDASGVALRDSFKELDMTPVLADASSPSVRTAVYSAMLNETGNLVAAVADMDCFDAITPDFVESNEQLLEGAACVVLDGNLSEPTLKAACLAAERRGVPVMFEPTSMAKCLRVVRAGVLSKLAAITPNRLEVFEIANAWRAENGLAPIDVPSQSALDEALASQAPITQLEGLGDVEDGDDADDAHIKYADDDFDGDSPVPAAVEGEGDVRIQAVNQSEASDEPVAVDKGGAEEDDDDLGSLLDVNVLLAAKSLLIGLCANPAAHENTCIQGRKYVFVKLGKDGVLTMSAPLIRTKQELDIMLNEDFFDAAFNTDMDFCLWPALPATMVNCTGAGDSMAGGILWGISKGWDSEKWIKAGLSTAKLSVESQLAVSPLVTASMVEEMIEKIE